MPTPLGAHSPVLEAVRALRTKKGRSEQGRFSFEGPTMLAEARHSGTPLAAVFVTGAALESAPACLEGLEPATPIQVIPDRAMARLSELESPPGILAVALLQKTSLAALLAGDGPLLLLCGVSDPGNAGTLLRSAEVFGFRGVLFGGDGVEPHNPKVVRASMGAIFRLPVPAVTPGEVLEARAAGYELIATGATGTPLPGFRFQKRSIIAIGNERRGVSGWLNGWDRELTIPQAGAGESLNAAVAGSIVAYAAAAQLWAPSVADSDTKKP